MGRKIGDRGRRDAAAGVVRAENGSASVVQEAVGAKGKKKMGARLWMRFERCGDTELLECDKGAIIRRASVPARDLRILGPVFSQSSNILAREKAMVVNLEFIKAIVTAEEALLLDPLAQEVRPFVEKLRQQLTKSPLSHGNGPLLIEERQERGSNRMTGENEQPKELPFEFQVLETALEFVCTYLDSCVADLEIEAYPVLDELAANVSTKNLETVRILKSNLTRLLARVQKVRDEIEHLLDDNEDMADLYLTRKQIQNQQCEALTAAGGSNGIAVASQSSHSRAYSHVYGSASMATSHYSDSADVEDLEMLLETYFMQLDGIRNKILSVREYIDDTEDYVYIQLDSHRNELIQLQLTLSIVSFAIAINTLIAGTFAMNLQCGLYNTPDIFRPFVGYTSSGCLFIFLIILGHAKWKKLLGS